MSKTVLPFPQASKHLVDEGLPNSRDTGPTFCAQPKRKTIFDSPHLRHGCTQWNHFYLKREGE